jgi:hypothetical protein
MADESSELSRPNVLLSAQRALLGAIGPQILGVCVNWTGQEIEVEVFAECHLSLDQKEDMEIVGTEIGADFPISVSVKVKIVENAQSPLRGSGAWVFVRSGYSAESQSDPFLTRDTI